MAEALRHRKNGSIHNGQAHMLRRSREADMLGAQRAPRAPAATEALRA